VQTKEAHVGTPDTIRAARDEVVRAHLRAEIAHDPDATVATFADANYDVVPLGAPTNGAAAVNELLSGLFEAFPDFTPEPSGAFHHADDIVFVDTIIRGTHKGTWAGVPATGNTIEVRCACVFHFDGDRLTKETVYFDHLTLLTQLGVTIGA